MRGITGGSSIDDDKEKMTKASGAKRSGTVEILVEGGDPGPSRTTGKKNVTGTTDSNNTNTDTGRIASKERHRKPTARKSTGCKAPRRSLSQSTGPPGPSSLPGIDDPSVSTQNRTQDKGVNRQGDIRDAADSDDSDAKEEARLLQMAQALKEKRQARAKLRYEMEMAQKEEEERKKKREEEAKLKRLEEERKARELQERAEEYLASLEKEETIAVALNAPKRSLQVAKVAAHERTVLWGPYNSCRACEDSGEACIPAKNQDSRKCERCDRKTFECGPWTLVTRKKNDDDSSDYIEGGDSDSEGIETEQEETSQFKQNTVKATTKAIKPAVAKQQKATPAVTVEHPSISPDQGEQIIGLLQQILGELRGDKKQKRSAHAEASGDDSEAERPNKRKKIS
ncbi:hypothetical protein CVT24_012484 [Panaeolus cyanescens]|uniref:Uncharacterized protein n=1 Tax=Panaeolus cyanescens TaxID=181874 RepID=A0A409W692_9AGAR|nr:hypothetical protein CVT24_012484 [Panaeolus cyanescens]